jgi:hypothetical protein
VVDTAMRRRATSDSTAGQGPSSSGPATLAEVLEGIEPMGDLSRFVIEDLTPEEEDEFFEILEGI